MRTARTQWWFVLMLILGLTAGHTEDMSKPGAGELLGQGLKDYWDRQTIEDCQRKTIPAIGEFTRRFLADGGGQHYAAEGTNRLTLCKAKADGREYMSAVYKTQVSIPPTKIRVIAKETIGKAGLKIEQRDDERDSATDFGWSDSKNGEFLMLSAHPTKGISFHFVPGCRPSVTKVDDPPPLKGVPTVPFTPQQETPSPSAASPSSQLPQGGGFSSSLTPASAGTSAPQIEVSAIYLARRMRVLDEAGGIMQRTAARHRCRSRSVNHVAARVLRQPAKALPPCQGLDVTLNSQKEDSRMSDLDFDRDGAGIMAKRHQTDSNTFISIGFGYAELEGERDIVKDSILENSGHLFRICLHFVN